MLTRMNLIGVIFAFMCGVNEHEAVEEDEEPEFIIIKKPCLDLRGTWGKRGMHRRTRNMRGMRTMQRILPWGVGRRIGILGDGIDDDENARQRLYG